MNKSTYLNVEYLITFGIILSQNGNSLPFYYFNICMIWHSIVGDIQIKSYFFETRIITKI